MDEATPTVARAASRAWRVVSGHTRHVVEVRACTGQGPCLARTWVPRAELLLPGAAAAGLLPEPVEREHHKGGNDDSGRHGTKPSQ